MNIQQSSRRIAEIGIIPIIRAADSTEARQAVQAIYAGGMSIVEITMTVPDCPTVIRDVVREYGDKILVGAGTVLNYEQATQCLDAGAEFLVSPGLCSPVLKAAQARNKLAIPGAMTPTELISATNEGALLIKIFPCENLGGPKYIKALKGPFPGAGLIPTGGVTLANVGDYFAAGSFAVGIGSELADLKALRAGQASEITGKAKALLESVTAALQLQRISANRV
ncbi:MAG TPA: bifunctional 4-hydroxy-2-oxoglutarate aldolase/2-dehydro-3-deoxy-phosphogluconate aldolase [Candidatus Acidoferrales bacterium]|nr:bifunctional 4-hydroxy-2-oxoglutarate aldolase/2-dehydro-3-deoxy-phosphogluconate aldolase [Candidatus Acidoferrales bacterium]